MPDRFLRVCDVAEMLGVSRSTVWRWQVERGLKVVTVGGVTRIRETELEAFLKRHEAAGMVVAQEATDSNQLEAS